MSLYHLHIDAAKISPELDRHVRERMGFRETNFTHVTDRYEHFEPAVHYTLKTHELAQLRAMFAALRDLFSASDFVGYLEAEYIALDVDLADQPVAASPDGVPFRATKSFLPPGRFRGSEIHVAMQTAGHAAPICDLMRSMGYFTAFMDKPDGLFSIFTLQGSAREIRQVLLPTLGFLERQGGYINCSVKEERVIDWWTSHAEVALPPVISAISWSAQPSGEARQMVCGAIAERP